MGVSKIRGTCLGAHIIGIVVFGGLCWGSLILGSYHIFPYSLLTPNKFDVPTPANFASSLPVLVVLPRALNFLLGFSGNKGINYIGIV